MLPPPPEEFPLLEEDTKPGSPSTARPVDPEATRRPRSDFADLPPGWRPRPRLESTTYSILPGVEERWTSAPPPSTARVSSRVRRADAEATDDGDLSPAQRREIDAMYASLATLSHYELLGVSRDASPAALRASYDDLARVFHPSRFAKKRLGARERKLEIIVACVNEAYLTLLDLDRRAAYDARRERKRAG